MRIGNRVRKIYERYPYPPPSLRGAEVTLALPSLEWIHAVSERSTPNDPRRILIAGCGVGTEAFAFAKRFPAAEVIGVDFSPRSIATAKKLQRTANGGGRVHFEVADITSPDLLNIAGDRFDLVSCHGVLSYVPESLAALRNFALCLAPAGVLALGVNGAAHPSARWRTVLQDFAIDVDEFKEGQRVREVLHVCQALSVYPPVPMADREAGYLAGDLFGPLNRALTLAEWSTLCREAGLHLLGSYHAYFAIRSLLNGDLHSTLMPRSRADVAGLVDAVQPTSFHQIALTRRAPSKAPWTDAKKLLLRRPLLTSLYTIEWPRRGGAWHRLRDLTLESPPTMTSVSLRVPQWEVEILRNSDGKRSLGEILAAVRPRVSATSLREAMYLLYQLAVVNLRPARR